MARIIKKFFYGVAILFLVSYALFPLYWACVSSVKTGAAQFESDLIPQHIEWQNYWAVLSNGTFGQHILNSIQVATLTVFFSIGVAVLAAYALGRMHFRGRKTLLWIMLSMTLFPQVAVLAGLFELMQMLNLYDSVLGLSLTYVLFTLPFSVWMLTTFMRELPKELEEAAILDGASTLVLIRKIILPLLWPAITSTALLAFIAAWNEFLFAVTFTLTDAAKTVPVSIAEFSGASQYELPWGTITAASVVVTLPLILLVLLCQKKIVSGLTAGAVKG